MARYRVYLVNNVSTAVEVEAENGDAAVDAALTQGLPGLMFLDHTYPDEGDWGTASEYNPAIDPSEDYELLED